MFRRTAEDLGLDKVLTGIASHCLSQEGRQSVVSAIPVFDTQAYITRQQEVSDVIVSQIQSAQDMLSAEFFPSLDDVFTFLAKNPTGVLTGEQIYNCALYVDAADRLRRILNSKPVNFTFESQACRIIEEPDQELSYMAQEVFKILESPGEVKKSYPTVKALIEKAERTRIDRTKTARALMHENSEIVQGENAVLRDGRVVIPIKNDRKNSIEGYLQGASQTGQTVYMEPFSLVDMNNAVTMALREIEIEIARLLGLLSNLVRDCEQKLRILSSQVRKADFLWAFASYSRQNNCCRVISDSSCKCNLIKARHPLLKEKCVPIDLKITSDMKAVVLTGPNAGGKTVTMKTAGLFALLNQICGYVPCSDGTSIALFDRVFTDIGDDQSIENQLSTFSGHMKSIGFILRSLTPDSLLILDELGSGTDPQEGAALARAVLEYCIPRASLVLTTSHHGVLKQFAYSSSNVLNASMEFDEKTLEPTFRVINGLPGESHAIDTAKRMRLPKTVTNSATKYLGQEAVKISSIIRGLEIKRKEAQDREAEILERLENVKATEKALENREKQLSAYETKLKGQMLQDFDQHLKQSRKQLENLVRELREGEITKEKTAKVKQFILDKEKERGAMDCELEQRKAELEKQSLQELEASAQNVELHEGMEVLCGQYKREGTIVRAEKNGKWVVAIGPMKFTFSETELTFPRRAQVVKPSYSLEIGSKLPSPKFELDLRGYRLEEAIKAVDDEIEACCVHGIKKFSIIHGYGEGTLSTGIHRHLKSHGVVEDYFFALPDDGGQGKTYVRLR